MVVLLNGEKIESIVSVNEFSAEMSSIDLNGGYLVPGFFDTQVNGGAGVLLNDQPSVAGMAAIARAHLTFGTTAMLPTLISDELAVVEQCLNCLNEALDSVPSVQGLHLEGPFLNAQRKGVHNDDVFCSLNEENIKLFQEKRRGRLLLTLAPEQNSSSYIKQLVDQGLVIAAGHTAANFEQTQAALKAGLSSFTHLYNAMTPLNSREPGVVGAALNDKESWVSIIVDGYHVHDASLKLALAAKPRGKVVLVTDAMPSVGAKEKSFYLNGELIQAREGRCATADNVLAGSDLDMLSALRNCVERLDIELFEAVNMASLYPAQMMSLDHKLGSIAKGRDASLLHLDKDLNLQELWQKGRYYALDKDGLLND